MSASQYKQDKRVLGSADGSSADALNRKERELTGEDDASLTPDMGVLHLISEIRKAESVKNDDWADYVEDEIKYFKAAVRFLHNDPQARWKYGQSIRGARHVVALLRQEAAHRDMQARLQGYVDPLIASNRKRNGAKAIDIPGGGSSSSGSSLAQPSTNG